MRRNRTSSWIGRGLLGQVGLLVLGVSCITSLVRAGNPPLGTFGNDAQRPVGAALQAICEYFNANPPRDQEESDLHATCNQMQGLPPEEIPAALQQVGTEEMAAEGTHATETSRGRVLLKRLVALRTGATGIQVSGLRLDIAGQGLNAGALFDRGPVFRSWGMSSAGAEDEPQASGAGGEGALFPDERWGLFANGMISFGEKDATAREDGFEFRVPGLTVGVDHRFGNDLIFGGAVGYEDFDGDFDTTPTVAGGSLTSDRLSLSAYTTYYKDHFYIDGIASFGLSNYEMERRIVLPGPDIRTASSATDGTQYELTAAFGYSMQRGAFQYSPSLRLNKLRVNVDAYIERDALGLDLAVAKQRIDSLASVLGSQLSWTTSPGGSVVIPQLHAEWHHEFDDETRALTARFVNDPSGVLFGVPTDEPDRDFSAVGGGFSVVWKGGHQAFLDVETVLGLRGVTNHVVTAGIRFTL